MKLEPYEQGNFNGGGNGGGGAVISTAGLPEAIVLGSAAKRDLKPLSDNLGIAIQGIMKRQNADDATMALDCYTKYSQKKYDLMYNDENGLMHRQAENAAGISEEYAQADKKLRMDILSKARFYNVAGKNALINMMNRSAEQGFQQVDQWRQKQAEVVKDNNLALSLDTDRRNVANAYSQQLWSLNDGTDGRSINLDAALGRAVTLITARYDLSAEDPVCKNMILKAKSGIVSSAIDATIAGGDFDTASNLLKEYNGYLSNEQVAKYDQTIRIEKKKYDMTKIANYLFETCQNDVDKALKDLNNETSGNYAERTRWAGQWTDADRRAIFGLYQQRLNIQRAANEKASNENANLLFNNVKGMYEKGQSFDAALKFADDLAVRTAEATWRPIPNVTNYYRSIVAGIYGGSGGSGVGGANGTKFNSDVAALLREKLMQGFYKSLEEYQADGVKYGANLVQLAKMQSEYAERQQGRGMYNNKYTGAQIVEKLFAKDDLKNMTSMDRRTLESAALRAFQEAYKEKQDEHPGKVVSAGDVQKILKSLGTAAIVSRENDNMKVPGSGWFSDEYLKQNGLTASMLRGSLGYVDYDEFGPWVKDPVTGLTRQTTVDEIIDALGGLDAYKLLLRAEVQEGR